MTISEIKETASILRKLLRRELILHLRIISLREKLKIAELKAERKAAGK